MFPQNGHYTDPCLLARLIYSILQRGQDYLESLFTSSKELWKEDNLQTSADEKPAIIYKTCNDFPPKKFLCSNLLLRIVVHFLSEFLLAAQPTKIVSNKSVSDYGSMLGNLSFLLKQHISVSAVH